MVNTVRIRFSFDGTQVINKKGVAREWLYFLVFFSIGLIGVPVALTLITKSPWSELEKFYYWILLGGGKVERVWAWGIVIAPYGAFQLIRSIVWTVTQLKRGEENLVPADRPGILEIRPDGTAVVTKELLVDLMETKIALFQCREGQ